MDEKGNKDIKKWDKPILTVLTTTSTLSGGSAGSVENGSYSPAS